MKRSSLLPAIVLCVVPAVSGAQDWPGGRPIRFEVTAAAGGLIDFVPRELAGPLSARLGVPVVVEDRPGGGGNIAANLVAKAARDGHTLLVTGLNQAVNPTLLPNPGFDYQRDLMPVAMVVSTKLLLVASPTFPAKNIGDVIAIAKQKPKSVSIATSEIGTPNYLAAQMLARYGNIDLTFVPYDGIALAMTDLRAGRVDLGVGAISTMLPQVHSGALKALAVISPKRSPLASDIPTSAEAGLPALLVDNWICFMGTGGSPASAIARLDEAIAAALALPEVQAAFAKHAVDIFYMNSGQLGEFLHGETTRFSELLK